MADRNEGRVVIVGAGHGGTNAAAFLRQQSFTGEVVLISDEHVAPYHRPPLSKKFITSAVDVDELMLKPTSFYDDQEIDLRVGFSVSDVHSGEKVLSLHDGVSLRHLHYDYLVLATGAEAREIRVPGADLTGVHKLRTLTDAEGIKNGMGHVRELVIVGGGYIGLEVAAACRMNDIKVSVLEREDRILARVASIELSKMLTQYHQERGTNIVVNSDVDGFVSGQGGKVKSVKLSDGGELPCDMALVGVGAVPRVDVALAAGLTCDRGVLVDERARTSDPSIFAIGDMTRRPLPGSSEPIRMESIPSAVEQARQAAAAILDLPRPKSEVPWFWSDQFDLKLKMVGVAHGDEDVVTRSSPDGAKTAFFHVRGETMIAVEAINASSEFMAGKRFIEKQVRVDTVKLADNAVPLRDVVTS